MEVVLIVVVAIGAVKRLIALFVLVARYWMSVAVCAAYDEIVASFGASLLVSGKNVIGPRNSPATRLGYVKHNWTSKVKLTSPVDLVPANVPAFPESVFVLEQPTPPYSVYCHAGCVPRPFRRLY
jgi:hypothetical protein